MTMTKLLPEPEGKEPPLPKELPPRKIVAMRKNSPVRHDLDDIDDNDPPLPKKLPRRMIVAMRRNRPVKHDLDDIDEKAALKDRAILAMQDHAIQFQDYLQGLRFVKLLEAESRMVAGRVYEIKFVGACDMHGETVYQAAVYDRIAVRKVTNVSILTPKGQCYTGHLCIPLISVTMDASSDVSPREIPAVGGDEDKLVFDDTTQEATLTDCAILAMQDHAIQIGYVDGLRLIQLLKFQTAFVNGYVYSIIFRGASERCADATYEADVYEGLTVRKVGRVRTIKPFSNWYIGTLSIPKVACGQEGQSTKRLRKGKENYAEIGDTNSAEMSPREMPLRKARATGFFPRELLLANLTEDRKAFLNDCAILAMLDHAIRFVDYREGLRFIKILEAVAYKEVVRDVYTITFLAACDVCGETTFKAVVFEDLVQREVDRVWTVTPPQDDLYAGNLCVPLIRITIDIDSSSDVSGDWNKLVLDGTTDEATLIDCAILAMQDHAIQNDYSEGLHFIKLLNYKTSVANGYVYSITFRGGSDQYGEATYEADVCENDYEREVGRVRTKTPPNKWYTGTLSVPKLAYRRD